MKTNIVPSTKLVSMSSSKMQSLSCDRFYFWQWVLDLVPKKLNMAFWFGTVMHAAFKAMVTTKKYKNICKIMDEASKIEIAKYALVAEDSVEIQLQLSIMKIIIKVYLEEYSSRITQLSETRTEEMFATKLTESPVIYEGTIDSYGYKRSKPVLIERKTTSTISDDFFKLLKFDIQINGYAQAIKSELLGEYPTHCIYEAFRKPKIKVRKDESPKDFLIRLEEDLHARKDWYYVSHRHMFGKHSIMEAFTDIERATAQLYSKYKQLSTAQLLNPYYWPRRQKQCLSYGVCPYFILCKNCQKYPLYLKLYQQRELRYENEQKELADKPLKMEEPKLKLKPKHYKK